MEITGPRGWGFKASWDADLCATTQRMSIGALVRNLIGVVLTCLSSSREFKVQQLTLAKCWALCRKIDFCTELGLKKVQLEGDALTVIKATQQSHRCCTWYGHLIEDIKQA